LFDYISGANSYEMSTDIGFLDAPFVIPEFHPVCNFDWRIKSSGLIM